MGSIPIGVATQPLRKAETPPALLRGTSLEGTADAPEAFCARDKLTSMALRLARRLPLFAALVSLSAVAACVADEPAVAPADGGVGGDAGAGEAGGGDASTDASGADAPTTFCSSHASAAFCEDFDRTNVPPWGFTATQTALGPVAVNTAAFTSAPNSALFPLSAATKAFQGTFLRAGLAPHGAKGVRVSFAIRVDNASGPESRDLVIVNGDGVGGIALHRASSGTDNAWTIGPNFAPLEAPPLHQWSHVVEEILFDPPPGQDAGATDAATDDAGGASGSFTVTIEGKKFGPFPTSGALPPPSSTIGLLLGSQSLSAVSNAFAFSVDDVVVELLP